MVRHILWFEHRKRPVADRSASAPSGVTTLDQRLVDALDLRLSPDDERVPARLDENLRAYYPHTAGPCRASHCSIVLLRRRRSVGRTGPPQCPATSDTTEPSSRWATGSDFGEVGSRVIACGVIVRGARRGRTMRSTPTTAR